MKAILATGLALLLVSPAMASKSRLEALGQSASGSYYIEDDRNVFLNPAYVTKMDDMFLLEWGDNSATTDNQATPRAEGGLYRKAHDGYLGLHLGNENETTHSARALAGAYLLPDNTLDVFYGKRGSDLSWGANVSYSNNKNESGTDQSETTMIVRAGALMDNDIEGYFHFHLMDTAEGTAVDSDEVSGSGIFTFGVAKVSGNWKYFGEYQTASYEDSDASGDTDIGGTNMIIGAAHNFDRADKLFFYSLALQKTTTENGTTDTDSTTLPVAIGAEKKVKDWLSLRGAITQNVLLNTTKTDAPAGDTTDSNPDTTTVSAGTSIWFDNFRFDNSFTTAGGTITTGNMLTRVSMNYSF